MATPAFDRLAIGRGLVAQARELARHSDSAEQYTRTYLGRAHAAAAARLADWMRAAGMAVRTDAVGSVIGTTETGTTETGDVLFFPEALPPSFGTLPGKKEHVPGFPSPVSSPHEKKSTSPVLLLGSHFDSVRNGGVFDGVLGILVAIACVRELHRAGERLPYEIQVAAFADEEGARFQTSFLASRALIGRFDPAVLQRRDASGTTLADAMREAGLDPARASEPGIDVERLAGYVEVHIEQGPVLLDEGRALGVVTTIAGGSRHRVKVRGEAGHAGTVPMPRRRDALAAASEMVLALERRCGAGGSLVGTVGMLEVKAGTGNVIPGEVDFTCDIRAGEDDIRRAAERDVFAAFEEIARRRGVALEATKTHEVAAVPTSPALQDRLAESVARVLGAPARRLPSGAGHDAMILAQVAPVGMLFVRCGAGGVSHNPAETVDPEDAGLAAEALLDFLRRFTPGSPLSGERGC